jgi:heme exporter protein C
MNSTHIRPRVAATTFVAAAAVAAIFLYAPTDSDQGVVQKVFYLHVPLAITALCGFIAGGVMGLRYLRTGDRSWDVRSYVTIHVSLVFAIGVLVTGSIWARASWGHWWVWNEPMLVSFLIVFLLYCCYQPLRFSIEDPERQARYAAVFAVTAGAFVPVNFMAVRLAQAYTHPRVLSATGGHMPGSMRLTFVLALAAVAMVFLTMRRVELESKRVAIERRRSRRQAAEVTTPEVAEVAL